MESNISTIPVASQKGRRIVASPSATLIEHFDYLLAKAIDQGFRVDGTGLAKALLSEDSLGKIEGLLFNDAALTFLKQKASRIEFIVDGPLPPDLLEEPPLKSEPIYNQVIEYGICKGCRLCILVCPKHVYKDDGFGRPDSDNRRTEECTGPHQCGQCVDVCPEDTIKLTMADPVFKSTIFVLVPNPYAKANTIPENNKDFFVPNPLNTDRPLNIAEKLNPKDLIACHRILDEAHFHPLIDVRGYHRHFLDSPEPEKDAQCWAEENGRKPELVLEALHLLYNKLPQLNSLREGKYHLDDILHRIIDEILHAEIEIDKSGGRELLSNIIRDSFIPEPFLGAKTRPIGGLLPPGTSIAWKTPYGEEIPDYVHMEKCLGPECGLCVTHCPEGGGGKNSALRMILKAPQGTLPSLVRGLDAFLIRLDGTHTRCEDLEDLSEQTPFEFEVDPDYCKACGICITCCPHDVIEPITRIFDMRKVAE